ncbi:MAG: cytochrome c-related protein [Chitinophagaceae bacterium]|nr:cytochrome c-related protein [Chitinophagaceae bacterium]
MKKFLRITLLIFTALLLVIAGLLTYVKTALPDAGPAPVLTVERTPERIKRGEYLANSVAACMDCHSTRDWSKFAGPLVPGTLGSGGETFDQTYGFPGAFYSKNITPFGLKDWTDGEILRAITSGVSKNGKALFPVMPHPAYGKLDKEDIYSIIAYLRTLPSVAKEVPASKPDFPMNFIINTIPKPAAFTTRPDTADRVKYGEYLFTASACKECHTKQDKGQPIEGMELAGGFEFKMPSGGLVRSSNITPDEETGIGNWTETGFVQRFRAYADSSYQPAALQKGNFNTIMPWMMYGKMKEQDLAAIYAYLKTVKPIKNEVKRFDP